MGVESWLVPEGGGDDVRSIVPSKVRTPSKTGVNPLWAETVVGEGGAEPTSPAAELKLPLGQLQLGVLG